jgi:hypothetical protein
MDGGSCMRLLKQQQFGSGEIHKEKRGEERRREEKRREEKRREENAV